ncbi:hypothetical protein SDC9_202820 [bioreactor metagenome]|uniref:Uncharacterized protein n=1 Tax=bioreactor metagenome TaxID=1076179 RepID=A0A645IUQ2_9ZZZZ
MCFFNEKFHQLTLGQVKGPAVEPHQERGFRQDCFYFRDILFKIIIHKINIRLHISQHLIEPLLAFVVGSTCSGESENGSLLQFARFEVSEVSLPYLFIKDDRKRTDNTGNIECLAGCHKR